ncbi:MAG: DUF4412 domain-containing protein [Rhodothermales bacterium]|nr:DUF4412 domain-containing protein [Rhodothermales bacterium]
MRCWMRWLMGVLVLATAAPALAFEGEIEAKSIGDTSDGAVRLKIYVAKNGDLRVDTSAKGPQGQAHRASYIKPAKGKYDYALDHDRKRATKIRKDTITKMAQSQPDEQKGNKANVEIKKLGTDTVAGQRTRHVRVIDKDEGSTADLWLSDRYPARLWQRIFSFGGDGGKSSSSGWTQVMEKEYGFKPGFVMKMLSKEKGGRQSGLEVTRMQEKKVTAGKVAVPSDYQVTEMPDMPEGIPNMKMPTTEEEAEQMREEWMKKMQEQQR